MEVPREIDVDLALPGFHADVDVRSGLDDAGVPDDDIEPLGGIDEGIDGRAVCDVRGDVRETLRRLTIEQRGGAFGTGTAYADDRRSGVEECMADRAADIARRTCDQDSLAIELRHQDPFPLSPGRRSTTSMIESLLNSAGSMGSNGCSAMAA